MSLPKLPSARLDGRKALVTGAGRGLGRAIAAGLAQVGAEVVLAARTFADVEATAEEIRREGGCAEPLRCDVSDIDATREAVRTHGPFPILVNNAGMNRLASFVTVTERDFDDILGLNLRAAFFLAQAVARQLIAAEQGGSIINMSSQMGLVGGEKRSVYCASKHALEGMTKAMAIELGAYGVRVNTVCPTFIDTPLAAPLLADPEFTAWAIPRIKLGRIGQVEDVMGAVVYLASDASALTTGSALIVDGGWTAD